ncbi:MAG: hypothetical protein V2A73_17530 [Pseudomonadota bacterium]
MTLPLPIVELSSPTVQGLLDAFYAAATHVVRNPGQLLEAARHAASLRVAIPLDSLRWVAARYWDKGSVRDVEVGSKPPALSVAVTIELMGNAIRASGNARIEQVRLEENQLGMTLRVANLALEPLDPASPVAQLLRSPSLDTSSIGGLFSLFPWRPPVVAAVKDDLLEIDLLKHPAVGGNVLVGRALAILGQFVEVTEVTTDEQNVIVSWRPRLERVRMLSSLLPGSR